jgi:hypothetical protein
MTDFLCGVVIGVAGTALVSAAVVWFLSVISCDPEPNANSQR